MLQLAHPKVAQPKPGALWPQVCHWFQYLSGTDARQYAEKPLHKANSKLMLLALSYTNNMQLFLCIYEQIAVYGVNRKANLHIDFNEYEQKSHQ